jgi:Flp pilus assembly protein TadD
LLASLAYASSLGDAFVFDDTEVIVANADIRSWDNIARAFYTDVWDFRGRPEHLNILGRLPYYRPMFTILLTVEYHLFGLWPQGYHVLSLLLHTLCAVAAYLVLRALSRSNGVSVIASLLFAVIPIHSEAVCWISAVSDLLFSLFLLTSLYFYLRASEPANGAHAKARPPGNTSGRWLTLAASLLMFLLCLLSKETGLSLVLLILAYECLKRSAGWRDNVLNAARRSLPYLFVTLFYLVLRYRVLGELVWKNPQAPDRPLAYTLLTLPTVIFQYLFHLLWPVNLSIAYDTHFVTSARSAEFILPAIALALLVAALTFCRRSVSRMVWFALVLVIAPLLPVLRLGQITNGEYLVFDRYLYLPALGWCYLLALMVLPGWLRNEAAKRSGRATQGQLKRPAIPRLTLIVLLLLSFMAVSLYESKHWADELSLWSNAARVRPAYWAAHYNMGVALLDAGRFSEAVDELKRAAALAPGEPGVFNALGHAYDGVGDGGNSAASYEHAIQMKPEMVESLNDLGNVYFRKQDFVKAEKYYTDALRAKPENVPARFNLGLSYERLGRYYDAARELEHVLAQAPADAGACYELGVVYRKMGRLAEAVHKLEECLRLTTSQELVEKMNKELDEIRAGSK